MSGKSYRRDRVDKTKSPSNEKIAEEKSEGKTDAKISEDDQASADTVCVGGNDVINIEEMELEKERQARESLDSYILETKRKVDWKEGLRSANNEAANNRSDDDKQFYKLDSSLKKNTAFIKKCKMFSESQRDSLIKVCNCNILGQFIKGIVY